MTPFPHNWADRLLIKVLEHLPIYEDSFGAVRCIWCGGMVTEHATTCLTTEIKGYLDAQSWMRETHNG